MKSTTTKRKTTQPTLLTLDEVAEFLGVSRWWVYENLRNGPPPRSTAVDLRRVTAVNLGRRRRWSLESLMRECGLAD